MSDVRAIDEVPWWLAVNDERIAAGTVLPEALEPFFAGRLAGEGVVASRAELLSLQIETAANGVIGARALVPLARARAAVEERRHRAEHGCGVLHLATCVAPRSTDGLAAPPPLEKFAPLFRALFADADTRHGGGVHAAALCDGTSLVRQFEDVGRHNAVDKAIGAALLDGLAPGAHGLVVTARISGEMAAKGVRSGIAWIASRSVPTTLAVRIAEANALPLIARAAGRDATLFGGAA